MSCHGCIVDEPAQTVASRPESRVLIDATERWLLHTSEPASVRHGGSNFVF